LAWLKVHAAEYGIDPERIVLAGGSAGGHLSLLTAYTPDHPTLTPEDVRGVDLSVRAAISYYGPTDLRLFYKYNDWGNMVAGADGLLQKTRQNPFLQRLLPGGEDPDRMNFKKGMAALKHLFPDAPDEAPEWFALVSPIEHVHAGCPATLLLYAGGDFGVPPAGALAEELRAAKVPVVNVVFPRAEHGFDALPHWSPAAQASFYDVDHFLALMV
jgi:acetyl esterase/lipase